MVWAQLNDPPPSLTSRRPDLPPAVEGVLAKALAKTPEGRYATCRDFADALRGALGLATYDSASAGQYTVVVTTTFSNGSQLEATETVSVP